MSKKLDYLVWGNPQLGAKRQTQRTSMSYERQNPRSPESFLSIFEPLVAIKILREDSALIEINAAIKQYTRQDIIEAALILGRTDYTLMSMMADLWAKNYTDNLEIRAVSEKMQKIIRKGATKIFGENSTPWPTVGLWTDDARAKIDEVKDSFEHFSNMLEIPEYKELFLSSGISFGNQSVVSALAQAEKLEARLPDTQYEEALKSASPTRLFFKISDDVAWFFIDAPACRFEAKMVTHCGASGGKLFSLRYRNEHDQWIPKVTAAYMPKIYPTDDDIGQGIVGEIRGKYNSKPSKEHHKEIMALLLSDAIQLHIPNKHRYRDQFLLGDLEDAQQKYILTRKPSINNYKIYKQNLVAKIVEIPKLLDSESIGIEEPYRLISDTPVPVVAIWETTNFIDFCSMFENYYGDLFREEFIPNFKFDRDAMTITLPEIHDQSDKFFKLIKDLNDRSMISIFFRGRRVARYPDSTYEKIVDCIRLAMKDGYRNKNDGSTLQKVKKFISELHGYFEEQIVITPHYCAIHIPVETLAIGMIDGRRYNMQLEHQYMNYYTHNGFHPDPSLFDDAAANKSFLECIKYILIEIEKLL